MSAPGLWFARVGFEWSDDERTAALALAAARPTLVRADATFLTDPAAIVRIVQAVDDDVAAWDQDEDEWERLWLQAARQHLDDELAARIAALAPALEPDIRRAATGALQRAGIDSAACLRAAANAALGAAQQAELAALAGETFTHFWFGRDALFRRGRWPLGYHRGSFYFC
jgi:hypothetical protein